MQALNKAIFTACSKNMTILSSQIKFSFAKKGGAPGGSKGGDKKPAPEKKPAGEKKPEKVKIFPIF